MSLGNRRKVLRLYDNDDMSLGNRRKILRLYDV